MKAAKDIFRSALIFIVIMPFTNKLRAQDSAKDKQAYAMKKMLDAKNFVFVAQSVTPQRGGYRQLTSSYDLKVSKDSVICSLPYFGQAYTAPIDPAAGGINFISTSFEYSVIPQKKNSWNVLIKPKDEKSAQQLFLNVYKNGTASLQVTSNDRQPILFDGKVHVK